MTARPIIVRPPHAFESLFDQEVERLLLGTVMGDPEAYDLAASLRPGDFGLNSHERLFRVIQRVALEIAPTILNVHEALGSLRRWAA